jgi:hypothetical protein
MFDAIVFRDKLDSGEYSSLGRAQLALKRSAHISKKEKKELLSVAERHFSGDSKPRKQRRKAKAKPDLDFAVSFHKLASDEEKKEETLALFRGLAKAGIKPEDLVEALESTG